MKSEATFTIGTLDGRLNRAHTQFVINALQEAHPRAIFDMVTVADPVSNKRAASELFTAHSPAEMEVLLAKLIQGEFQLLDVSADDLNPSLPDGLLVAAVLDRSTPYDALLHKKGFIADDLPEGCRVGVLNQRSQAQIASLWPATNPKLIYGGAVNALDAYLQNDEMDCLVMPASIAELLGVQDLVSEIFFPEMMLPGAGQGTKALLAREQDHDVIAMAQGIHSEASGYEMAGELAFRERICSDQDCPVGVLAQAADNEIILTGAVGSPKGGDQDQAVLRGVPGDAIALGQRLAERLLLSHTSLVDLLEADFPDGLPAEEGDDADETAVFNEGGLDNVNLESEEDEELEVPDEDPLDDFAEPRDDY